MGLPVTRRPAAAAAEAPFVAPERTPPAFEVLVAFHPPEPLV